MALEINRLNGSDDSVYCARSGHERPRNVKEQYNTYRGNVKPVFSVGTTRMMLCQRCRFNHRHTCTSTISCYTHFYRVLLHASDPYVWVSTVFNVSLNTLNTYKHSNTHIHAWKYTSRVRAFFTSNAGSRNNIHVFNVQIFGFWIFKIWDWF